MANENQTDKREYSIAVFEDGTKEIIPEEWIQDYLKDDEMGDQPNGEGELQQSAQCYNQNENIVLLNPNHSESTKIVLENLMTEVSEIRSEIIKLHKSVERLICIATGEPEPEINLNQPAETLEKFLAIEEHIKVKYNYNELVSNLGKIGGKTVEATTRKIWKKLCNTKLAAAICWTGANGKHCLRQMQLNNVVRDAVLITHPTGKECDIQRATMLWFSHAQDRLRAKKLD